MAQVFKHQLVAETQRLEPVGSAQAGVGDAPRGMFLVAVEGATAQQGLHFEQMRVFGEAHAGVVEGAGYLIAVQKAALGLFRTQAAQQLGQLFGAFALVDEVVEVELLFGLEARIADNDGENGLA